MEALNGSAFLPLLAVLEFLGLKISWFPIRVGETVVATKVGLPKIALDLVLTAWMAGLMNNGYNFCVEILLVVSVAEIPLVVVVATLGSLFGSLPSTINFLESFITSTCSAESFLNQFLASTCSLESTISSTYSSDWILHPLKFSTISARTPAALQPGS